MCQIRAVPEEPPETAAGEFADAVAGWMKERHGWAIDPEMVSIVPDTMRVLEIAIDRFTEPGWPVVLTDPIYPPFRTVIEEPCPALRRCSRSTALPNNTR